MLTLDAVQTALVASDNKTGRWAIHIKDAAGVGYSYYSDAIGADGWATDLAWTPGIAWSDGTGNNSVVLMDFSGIELRRNTSEAGIIAPSDITFSLSNPSNTLAFTAFKGGTVLVELFLWNPTYGEHKINGWRFNIKTCEPGYQKLDFTCEDFLQDYLRGYYPNTRLPEDIFPSNRTYIGNMVCVPVPFGAAYVPLRDVYITDIGYIVLGSPSYTYTISKIRSPRSLGLKSEWDSASYAFTQSTKTAADATTWRVFQAIIADGNNDTVVDTHGFWGTPGGPILDPPVLFSRSDTVSISNPADVIKFILLDMGITSTDINTASFTTAGAVYTGWGLTFKGAFWYKQDRQKVLSLLLTMCHSCLDIGETISLRVLTKASKATITGASVLRTSEQGEGSFSYQNIANEDISDSGYIAFQEDGEAQDALNKTLVSTGGTATKISSDLIECPFVQDSQNVKRIGTLHYQRKLGMVASVGFIGKSTLLANQADDIITINAANYGGTYTVLVDSIRINKDLSIQFGCTKFKAAFSDWDDLTPSEYAIPVDDTTHPWSAVITGPDSPGTPIPLNAIADRLRVGNGAANYLLIEPADPRLSVYNSGEKLRLGNLNGYLGVVTDLFGFGVGVSTAGYANLIYDTTNGLRLRSGTTNAVHIDNAGNITITGGISASTIDIGGDDATSFHVDIGGGIWSGASIANKATAPFRVSNAGAVVATTATITGAINATSGKFGTSTNYWSVGATGLTATTASTDVIINYGKLDFGSDTLGFILGYDYSASKPKFEMGDATNHVKFDGTAWTITKGTLIENIIRMYTSVATIRTSATAGDGSAGSAGMVVTYEGLFGCGANQTSTIAAANANVRILATGAAFFAGAITASTIDIGGDDTTSFHVDTGGGIWSGASIANKATAPFRVSSGGDLVATSATITGAITANTGYLGGTSNGWTIAAGLLTANGTGIIQTSVTAATGIKIDSTSLRGYNGTVQTVNIATDGSGWFGLTGTKAISWTTAGAATIAGYTATATALYAGTTTTRIQLDTAAGVHLGATAFADAPFRVSLAGALTATNATISGAISAATIDIGGDDATSFHVDAAGGIWSGASIANKATAPFRVSSGGALVATSATITGAITASTGSVGSFTIGTYLYSGSKTAYNDAEAGVHLGSDGIGIGNNLFTVSAAGALVATSATIYGNIRTAASGERLEFLASDKKLHFYNSAGTEVVTIGEASTNPYASAIYVVDAAARSNTVTQIFAVRSGTADSTAGIIYNYGLGGSVSTTRSAGANDVINIGSWGYAGGGQANYGIWADYDFSSSVGGPLRISPSGSASAPSHTAWVGTLWATSAGVLYINTDGGTTWAKVGAQ